MEVQQLLPVIHQLFGIPGQAIYADSTQCFKASDGAVQVSKKAKKFLQGRQDRFLVKDGLLVPVKTFRYCEGLETHFRIATPPNITHLRLVDNLASGHTDVGLYEALSCAIWGQEMFGGLIRFKVEQELEQVRSRVGVHWCIGALVMIVL
jgi:hypothetical protein